MRKAALLAVAVLATAGTGVWAAPAGAATTCDGLTVTIQGTPGNDTNLKGTAGFDVIAGLGGNDTIDGLGGDDTICAGQGNDVVIGGTGYDTFIAESVPDGKDVYIGGTGLDRVSYATRTAPLTLTMNGSAVSGAAGEKDAIATDVEDVDGGLGDDTITGNMLSNYVHGGRGVDHIFGGPLDNLYGDAGDDVISVSGPETSTVAALGGDGNDILIGSDMRDYFWGENGRDTLSGGGDGYDMLDGGASDDTLDARDGEGFDQVIGGPGVGDTCRADSTDTVSTCEL